jgi:hypothetical protein
VGAGSGAVLVDQAPCMNDDDSAACVGMVLGGVGVLFGGGATVADLLGSDDLADVYGVESLAFGGIGTSVDALAYAQWLTTQNTYVC